MTQTVCKRICECGAPSISRFDEAHGVRVFSGICWDCRDAQLRQNGCDGYVDSDGRRISKAFTSEKGRVKPAVGGGKLYTREKTPAELSSETKRRKNGARAAARRRAEREGRMPKKEQDNIPMDDKPLPKGAEFPRHQIKRMRQERLGRMPDLSKDIDHEQ